MLVTLRSCYLAMNGRVIYESRVEAVSNTSTVTLLVEGGDENGTQCRDAINWVTLFLALQVGESRILGSRIWS
jgi:hypothetical protein